VSRAALSLRVVGVECVSRWRLWRHRAGRCEIVALVERSKKSRVPVEGDQMLAMSGSSRSLIHPAQRQNMYRRTPCMAYHDAFQVGLNGLEYVSPDRLFMTTARPWILTSTTASVMILDMEKLDARTRVSRVFPAHVYLGSRRLERSVMVPWHYYLKSPRSSTPQASGLSLLSRG
jgi:hypothetical protein